MTAAEQSRAAGNFQTFKTETKTMGKRGRSVQLSTVTAKINKLQRRIDLRDREDVELARLEEIRDSFKPESLKAERDRLMAQLGALDNALEDMSAEIDSDDDDN
jgi:hypothetical protein